MRVNNGDIMIAMFKGLSQMHANFAVSCYDNIHNL